MATTGSTGLNNFLADTYVKETTLPAWYDAAQQGIASGATQALAAAPAFQSTVGQQAVNTLQGANNPFNQAQGYLGQIASGAANPWITGANGQVTPNTSTAMGGLFQAQNQQLNQLLPNATAPVQGSNIASGNFGSLRGETAVDKAKADAFSTLAAQQMQSALQNQSTGATAGANLGNVAQQNLGTQLTAGNTQMNAPFQNLGSYANLINDMSVPGLVKQQNQMSPFSQIAGVSTAGNSILNSLGLGNSLTDVGKGLGSWLTNLQTNANFGSNGLSDGMTNGTVDNSTGTGNIVTPGNAVSNISTND
jgi:hypothetical protein